MQETAKVLRVEHNLAWLPQPTSLLSKRERFPGSNAIENSMRLRWRWLPAKQANYVH